MKPERFVSEELGWMSSHPRFQRQRRRLFLALALVPLAVLIVAGVLLAMNIENWLEMVKQYWTWFVTGGAALSFALGALLTMAISDRWAELQQRGQVQVQPAADPEFVERWVLAVGLVLGVVGPMLAVTLHDELKPQVRFLFHMLAIAPLAALLISMWALAGRPQQKVNEDEKRRPIWVLLLFIVLALMAVVVVHDVTTMLGRKSLIGDLLSGWFKPFGSVWVLAIFAFILLCVWRLWRATTPVKIVTPEEAEQTPEKPGFFARMFAWAKRLVVPAPRVEVKKPENPWPPWLDELLGELPSHCRAVDAPEQLETPESAPQSTADELRALFGGVTPTVDQLELFHRFRDSYQDAVRDDWSWQTGGSVAPSADLLAEGDSGSGRTTALVACAVYAALGRGQRVLYVAPDRQRQQIIQARIEQVLARLRIDRYIQCSDITRDGLEGWLALDESSPQDALPHIFVATLESVEQHLYGAAHLNATAADRLRRLVHLIEVVMVDDFMDFDDAQRSHLPFLLDKQRLLLEADYTPLQVIVTCPRLADFAKNTFGARLFTELRLRSDNVVTLRQRRSGTAWLVHVEADAVAAAVDKMVVWCLRQELDVVLYRRGVDEGELRRQEAELRRAADGRPSVYAIGDLDQPLQMPANDVDAVFYHVAAHEDVCLALRARMGHNESVIFSVRPTGEVAPRPVLGIAPVVADRSAQPLMIAHLASAARFLRPNTPIAETTWAQFGFHYKQLAAAGPDALPEIQFGYDDWLDDDLYGEQLFPYVVSLHEHRAVPLAVDPHVLPMHSRAVGRSALAPGFFIYRVEQDDSADGGRGPQLRRGQWYTSAGQSLGRYTQLDHACELRLARGTEVFVPRPQIGVVDGHVRLTTQHWRGNGEDSYLPVFRLAWQADALKLTPLGGGPDYGIQWFRVDAADGLPPSIEATIEKLMTEYGAETPINPFTFSYPANLSCCLLHPQPLESEALAGALAGPWSNAAESDWSPALTGAINYALHARLPGLSYFTRCLSFWPSSELNRLAGGVIWFIEPVTVGRTVMPILSQLWGDSQQRRGFFQSAAWLLEHLQKAKSKQRFLRRFARVGYTGDDAADRAADAEAIIELLTR